MQENDYKACSQDHHYTIKVKLSWCLGAFKLPLETEAQATIVFQQCSDTSPK